MEKDDYFVLAYRILSYLYACLKADTQPDMERLACGTKDFPIQREYWEYIFRHLSLDGYLEGVMIIPMAGGCPDRVKIGQLQITPKGIAYLQENTMMQKAKDFLKEIKEIVPGL